MADLMTKPAILGPERRRRAASEARKGAGWERGVPVFGRAARGNRNVTDRRHRAAVERKFGNPGDALDDPRNAANTSISVVSSKKRRFSAPEAPPPVIYGNEHFRPEQREVASRCLVRE